MKRAFGSLDAQNLRKINLMFFKLRNVATLSTPNQHNLNIGISRYVLYRRTQKTGALGKGPESTTEGRQTRPKDNLEAPASPHPQRDMVRAVGQGARADWRRGLPS